MTAAAYRACPALTDLGPVDFARSRKTRLLTAGFGPGDVVLLDHLTLHGAADNTSPDNIVRLSSDLRYQPAAFAATDPRFFGPSPSNSTGGGYGDMSGAQPLTAVAAMAEDRSEVERREREEQEQAPPAGKIVAASKL